MKIFGDRMNLRIALVGVLLGAVMQAACVGEGVDGEPGDPSTSAPGPVQTKPDLNIPAAVPGGGATAGKGSPAKGSGGAPTADAETMQPPTPNDACTLAGAPCAGGSTCAVAADGQPACKLKDRAVCAADDECASGSCGSIVVPPDPSDPYDLGYTYVGCK